MSDAKAYKIHGYTHVCIRRENGIPTYLVGFRNYYQLKKYEARLQIHEEYVCELLTVNQAIAKGY